MTPITVEWAPANTGHPLLDKAAERAPRVKCPLYRESTAIALLKRPPSIFRARNLSSQNTYGGQISSKGEDTLSLTAGRIALFDGHGGSATANRAWGLISKIPLTTPPANVITTLARSLQTNTSGSTATVITFSKDKIVGAHIGDSPAILVYRENGDWFCRLLTHLESWTDTSALVRIMQAGKYVRRDVRGQSYGMPSPEDGVNTTRSLGDSWMGPLQCSDPFAWELPVSGEWFVVAMSDGIVTDSMTFLEVAQFVIWCGENHPRENPAKLLVEKTYAYGMEYFYNNPKQLDDITAAIRISDPLRQTWHMI